MADNNKPLKYMRYAIGEIVLVVIGILIALQINNWNENKKSKARILYLLENVQKELIANINGANSIIAKCRYRDITLWNINNKAYTIDDYRKWPGDTKIIKEEFPFSITDNAFNNLINSKDEYLSEHNSLIINLKELYITRKNNIESTNEDEKKMVYDFINFLRDTKAWYPTYMLYGFIEDLGDEINNYFLTDPSYFNFAADFSRIATTQKLEQTHAFRGIAISIYKEIDEILLKENKDHEIISPMPSYNALDYKHFIGSYKSEYGIAEIKIKNGELLYSWIGSEIDWNDFTTKIHPTSESEFTLERLGQNLLYTLKFNDNNEVIGKTSHIENRRDFLEKIK